MKSLALAALTAGAALVAPSLAHAQALTISQPGTYVLQRNINVASGDGIRITASGVTLDLNGRTVSTGATGTGRGIVIENAKGVVVKNGKIGPFNMNVFGTGVENCSFDHLQIVGAGLAPMGGPVEIGFALVNARANSIRHNTVSSVNLGLIVRGAASGGNRISDNSFVGGATAANNLLALCWNPLAGAPATDPGPIGDLVYNNHISQFTNGLSASAGSKNIVFRENTISFFGSAFTAATFANPANNNVNDGNIENQING